MGKNVFWYNTKVTKKDREKLLNQKSLVLWFFGLSASGKSTIASELEKKLFQLNKKTYILDGDNIRKGLNSDLDFSMEHRLENIRRISEIAKLFFDAGIITLVSFITPLNKMRILSEKIIGEQNLIKIFVKTKIETCKKRDPKGLYKKVEQGLIKNFTGISSVFEKPEKPDLILDTDKYTVKECVEQILKYLKFKTIKD